MALHQAAGDADSDQEHCHDDQDDDEEHVVVRPGFVFIPMDVPGNVEITRVPKHDVLLSRQPTFTSIAFGLTFSDFARWTFSTPSLYSAVTLLPSASSGNVKLRRKLPYARSTR